MSSVNYFQDVTSSCVRRAASAGAMLGWDRGRSPLRACAEDATAAAATPARFVPSHRAGFLLLIPAALLALFTLACGQTGPGQGVKLALSSLDTSSAAVASDSIEPVADSEANPDLAAPPDALGKTCSNSSDCGTDLYCKLQAAAPVCVGCLVPSHCGSGHVCIANQCVAAVPCSSDKACAAQGAVCDPQAGACVECLTSADCAEGLACHANLCVPPAKACSSSKECADLEQVCDKSSGTCAHCADAADCPENAWCYQALCVPDICKPGSSSCLGIDAAALCSADGSGIIEQACPNGQACEDDACQPTICKGGSLFCDAADVKKCSPRGTASGVLQTCGSDQLCVDGACLAKACQPGSSKCLANGAATCNSDGLGYTATPCPKGKACDDADGSADCTPQLCEPGAGSCSGTVAFKCDVKGLTKTKVDDCSQLGSDGKPRVCISGACVSQKCLPGSVLCTGGSTLATCAANGVSYWETPCNAGEICEAKQCKPVVCASGEQLCLNNDVKTCNDNGTALETTQACGPTAFCVASQGKAGCAAQLCKPSSVQCNAQATGVEVCNAGGSAWQPSPCAAQHACEAGQCKPVICSANTLGCNGSLVVACNGTGTAAVAKSDCAALGKGCAAGQCVDTQCGDGKVNQAAEQCDDGNQLEGDGCGMGCQTEASCAVACPSGTVCQTDGSCAKPCQGAGCSLSGSALLPTPKAGLTLQPDGVALQGIQLGAQAARIWISNSPQNTVTKLNTQTGKEIGRYTVCPDPSRTAVDFNGDAWIACRGNGAVAKIINNPSECIDKDGNGSIQTSAGSATVANDECIAFIVNPGKGAYARAIGIDRENHAWVGYYVSSTLVRLDPKTGATKESVALGCNPYGLALDQTGAVWLQGVGCGSLLRYDPVTKQLESSSTNSAYKYPAGAYGLAVDGKGRIWVASGTKASAFDPKTMQWQVISMDKGGGRGLAAADDGMIYVALDGSGGVMKIDGNSSPPKIVGFIKGGGTPVGAALDYEGNVWVVNQGGSSASKLDPKTMTSIGTYPVGSSPYTYSDMTGYALRFVGPQTGQAKWSLLFYSPAAIGPLASAKEVTWTALGAAIAVPPGASAQVRARTAAQVGGLANQPWSPALLWSAAPTLDLTNVPALSGAWLEVEISLQSNAGGQSPVVGAVSASAKIL